MLVGSISAQESTRYDRAYRRYAELVGYIISRWEEKVIFSDFWQQTDNSAEKFDKKIVS